jgi:hypothetical protein
VLSGLVRLTWALQDKTPRGKQQTYQAEVVTDPSRTTQLNGSYASKVFLQSPLSGKGFSPLSKLEAQTQGKTQYLSY